MKKYFLFVCVVVDFSFHKDAEKNYCKQENNHIFVLQCVILNRQGPPGEKGEKGDLGFPGLQVFPKFFFNLSLTMFEC